MCWNCVPKECPSCQGEGYNFAGDAPCSWCKGVGYVDPLGHPLPYPPQWWHRKVILDAITPAGTAAVEEPDETTN